MDLITTVKIAKLPGVMQEFVLNGDRSVKALLALSGHNAAGYQIRVSGEVVDVNATLKNGDIVILSKQIKGN